MRVEDEVRVEEELLLTVDVGRRVDVEVVVFTDVGRETDAADDISRVVVGRAGNADVVVLRRWVLDDVADPGNLGTIIRSSLALGIEALIVSPDTVDEYNDKVLRATQGAIFKLPIFRENLEKAISNLKEQKIPVLVTSLKGAVDVATLPRMDKFAVVLGNEAHGVKEKIVDLADKVVKITMYNNVESLNVGKSFKNKLK